MQRFIARRELGAGEGAYVQVVAFGLQWKLRKWRGSQSMVNSTDAMHQDGKWHVLIFLSTRNILELQN